MLMEMNIEQLLMKPPIIQDNIWPPNIAARDPDRIQSIVVLLLPGEVGVHPHLADPQVRGEDLVALILGK